MASEVFTEGIAHGGLTTDYEIRILICWLLEKVRIPVTVSQLSGSLLGERLVNYFEVTRAVSQLLESGHIEEIEREGEKALILTELGKKTSQTFYKTVALSVREKAVDALSQCVLQDRFAKENRTEIVETEDGFRLELSLNDVGNDLMTLSLYAPSREICETMRKRFLTDPTKLYRLVLSSLMGEKQTAMEFVGHEPIE